MGHSYDSTQLQAMKNCPYQFKLTYVDGLKRREEGATEHDRNYGAAMHDGFAQVFRNGDVEEAKRIFTEAYPVQLDESDKAKTQENGLLLLEEFSAWVKQNYAGYEVVEIEQVGQIKLPGDILFTVKPDLVLRNKGSGEYYAADHKTTKNSLQASFWNRFDPAAWVTAQSAYVEQKYGSCSGVFVNGISFGYRSRAYKGEPPGFHSNMERQLFNRNSLQISRWKEDALTWIGRIEESKQRNVWGKNTQSCQFCSFRPICISEWTPEEDMSCIEEMYLVGVNAYAYLEDTQNGTKV